MRIFSPMIKNLAIVGFNDLCIGIIDQHIRAAHVGPVGACRRRGQVAQIPLFNGVFFGEIQWWNLVTGFEMGEVSNKAAQFILIDTGGAAVAAGAAQTTLLASRSAPSNILFFIPILSTSSGHQNQSCIIPGIPDV